MLQSSAMLKICSGIRARLVIVYRKCGRWLLRRNDFLHGLRKRVTSRLLWHPGKRRYTATRSRPKMSSSERRMAALAADVLPMNSSIRNAT